MHQDGTTVHAPWKMSQCAEPGAANICLIKRVRPGICPCEHNSFAISTQNDPEVVTVRENEVRRAIVKCGSISQDSEDTFRINVVTAEGHSPVYGLPFTMRDLLPLVARNNMVVVTGVTYAYRDVLMNFVCNLRRLGIYDHLLIAAFDEETYRFGFRMGLPVFFYDSQTQSQSIDTGAREAAYGSEGFKSLTKLKSQIVLQILRMGYDVIWSDTDIVWYRNPLPLLAEMPSDLVVQSNAPWPDEPSANGPLRINSGFYRVRSTPATLAAFEAIVGHARSSSMSEQPSFYIVLCGGKDGINAKGENMCVFHPPADFPDGQVDGQDNSRQNRAGDAGNEGIRVGEVEDGRDGGDGAQGIRGERQGQGGAGAGKRTRERKDNELEVTFLNRLHYPNGAVGQLWEAASNVSTTHPEVIVLHNNWIRGLQAKIRRLIEQRLWWFDRNDEVCDYSPSPHFEFNWNVEEIVGEEA